MNRPITPEQMLKQLRDNPGAHILFVGHDQSCPGAHGQPDQCSCQPTHQLCSSRELLEEVETLRLHRTMRGRPR